MKKKQIYLAINALSWTKTLLIATYLIEQISCSDHILDVIETQNKNIK